MNIHYFMIVDYNYELSFLQKNMLIMYHIYEKS